MRCQCLPMRRSRVHRPRSRIRRFCSATARSGIRRIRFPITRPRRCASPCHKDGRASRAVQPVPVSSAVSLKDILRDGKLFEFKASEPLRYLALVVARFTRIVEVDVSRAGSVCRERRSIDKLTVAVEAQSSQRFARTQCRAAGGRHPAVLLIAHRRRSVQVGTTVALHRKRFAGWAQPGLLRR